MCGVCKMEVYKENFKDWLVIAGANWKQNANELKMKCQQIKNKMLTNQKQNVNKLKTNQKQNANKLKMNWKKLKMKY